MRPLTRLSGIADVLTYPFVIATVRWLAVLFLLTVPGEPHMSLQVRLALVGYAFVTMVFAAGWWHRGQFALRRDEQHPMVLPAILVIDSVYAILVAKTYAVTFLCMLPALDVALLDLRLALPILAVVDIVVALVASHFHADTVVENVLHTAGLTIGPYLAVAYGLHGRVRAEHQIRAIDQLLHAGSDLGAQLSLGDVLKQLLNLLRQFRRVVGWDTAVLSIVQYDEAAAEHRLVAVETAGTDAELHRGTQSGFSDGVVGYAASKQRSVLVADLHKDARETEQTRSPAARSCMVVPIVSDGQTVGCVQLLAAATNYYSAEQLGLIARLMSLAAVGVRNAILHSRTLAMADIDSLTGLLTARAYHERLESEFRKAQAARRSLSLLIVDVDNFKRINDTYGHPAGDEMLRRVGAVIRQHARRNDVCCRYGGDEFVVVMPETIKSDAAVVAGRICSAIGQEVFVFDAHSMQTTVSIGAASYPQDVTTKQSLIKAADAALYTAKHDGRNALRVFGSPVA
ncbi:MAG: sensor domain-containing diguanylate cyclase [Candidatus Eremiobacteraeota bacterium]|nr:sensor domain-containing diguanylate cyclase [Candidatus Eremiobacteraeota bacterium]